MKTQRCSGRRQTSPRHQNWGDHRLSSALLSLQTNTKATMINEPLRQTSAFHRPRGRDRRAVMLHLVRPNLLLAVRDSCFRKRCSSKRSSRRSTCKRASASPSSSALAPPSCRPPRWPRRASSSSPPPLLLGLQTVSMLIEGVGMPSRSAPAVQITRLHLELPELLIYGLELTYLETATGAHGDSCLAVVTLCRFTRGTPHAAGKPCPQPRAAPAQWMPLLVGAIAWVFAVGLLILTDRAPTSESAADVAARCERGTMSRAQRSIFEYAESLSHAKQPCTRRYGRHPRRTRSILCADLRRRAGRANSPTWGFMSGGLWH